MAVNGDAVYFLGMAVGLDGTLASRSAVPGGILRALRRLKESGRRLILVTAREIETVAHLLENPALFDRIVAENGGVTLDPASGAVRALSPPPSQALVEKLMDRGVEPISVGRTMVTTWRPHANAVLEALDELGLDLQIAFNKGSLIILPAGINKGSGLVSALDELGLSPVNTVGVGDAENDHPFLRLCGLSAAVANALPSVKQMSDLALPSDHARGVRELIDRVLSEDVELAPPARHGLFVGLTRDGAPVHVAPSQTLLIVGGSGSGKSSFATLLTERLARSSLTFTVFDPEGDYEDLASAISVGDDEAVPSGHQLQQLLERTSMSMVISALAVAEAERCAVLRRLISRLSEARSRSGRPHWVLVDEAHQVLPKRETGPGPDLSGSVLITADPTWISQSALAQVNAVLALGRAASHQIQTFARERGFERPVTPPQTHTQALYWSSQSPDECLVIELESPKQNHRRHRGKYAIGDVGEDQAFVFSAENASYRAHNLAEFVWASEQVNDGIWTQHLRAGDFAAWFFNVIRDEELGRRTMAVAADPSVSSLQCRREIREAISERYRIAER